MSPDAQNDPTASGSRAGQPNWPLAYLITFTVHGTWLQGDVRGSVDRHHNHFGTPRFNPNAGIERAHRDRAPAEPSLLSPEHRDIVERTIREVCQHRSWTLHAVSPRTNHVHSVVSGACPPEQIMGDFKAYATRRLREAGLMPDDGKTWTRHGSTRYLWDPKSLEGAIRYVSEDQDLPRPADWKRPR